MKFARSKTNKIWLGILIVIAILTCIFLVWKLQSISLSKSQVNNTAGFDQYATAILACYHQEPGSDINEPIPNNSVQNVKETSRMFINMPNDLYPKDISRSWTTVTGNATGGYVSNGGLPGEAVGALPGCWSTYVDFEGNGEVDLRVKSTVADVPDYFVRFIVGPTWETYTNATYSFAFQYPPSYKIVNDQVSNNNSGKRVSVTLQSSKNTLLQAYGETTAHNCYLNLCDLPAKEQKVYNGITWDYLGETNYCDAGSCGASWARYRTTKGDMNYYLSFTNPADAEPVLQTFRFEQ
jgi:hypothetical protein